MAPPGCPRMGFGGVPGWRGAVPCAPAALSHMPGGAAHRVPSPGWTQGPQHPGTGIPGGQQDGHTDTGAGLCPPARSPSARRWQPGGLLGAASPLGTPGRGESGEHFGCGGLGAPRMWRYLGMGHTPTPSPGLNPSQCQPGGCPPFPPPAPPSGKHSRGGGHRRGVPPNPLSAGKGCPFGATPARHPPGVACRGGAAGPRGMAGPQGVTGCK